MRLIIPQIRDLSDAWRALDDIARVWNNEHDAGMQNVKILPSSAAPVAPSSGAVLYVDAADGKLKAVKSTGSVVVIG